jgi:tetratricopeptide (TPR) repeat protein
MRNTAALCVVGLILGSAAAAEAQDRVTLRSGTVRTGRIRDTGRNFLLLEMPQATDRIPKREVARVQLGRPESGDDVDSDRVELKGGRIVAGEVSLSPDGKSVVVRAPGVGSAYFPKEEVVRIIRRGEAAAERPADGPEELKARIAKLVERLQEGGAGAQSAEKELRVLGVFAIEPLEDAAKSATGDTALRIRAVLRSYELKKVVGDALDNDLPQIYEGVEAPQPEERIEALRAALLVAPDEAVALVLFVLEDPQEDATVRSFCVELLRRLNRYRELIEAYDRADASLALALAVALGENGVYIGVPCLISALGEEDRGLRDLAAGKLKSYTGEDYAPAQDAAPEEWKKAAAKYQAWWNARSEVIMERTRAMASSAPQATPQRARAVQYWQRGAEQESKEEYALAEKSFRQALDEDPTYSRAALSLGILLYSGEKKYSEAMGMLEHVAMGRYPDATDDVYATAMFHLGVIQRERRNYKEAIEWFNRAVEAKKHYIGAYLAAGDLYYQWALMGENLTAARRKELLGEAESVYRGGIDAVAAYEKELVVLPVDSSAIGDNSEYSRRNYLRSLKDLRDLLAKRRTILQVSLARVYMIQGANDKAEELVRQVVTRDAENPELQLLLARLFERKGDKESALRSYRAVLRLDPQNEPALQGLFRCGGTLTPAGPEKDSEKAKE